MTKTDPRELIKQFTDIRTQIVKTFEDKQEIDFGVDSVGMNEYYFSNDFYVFGFDDMVIDLSTNQEPGVIKQWFNECVSKQIEINYKSYCMGFRPSDLKK